MGRASRQKREAREGRPPPLKASKVPWWAGYVRVYQFFATIERESSREAAEFPLLEAVRQAHVFYVDPVLVHSDLPSKPDWQAANDLTQRVVETALREDR